MLKAVQHLVSDARAGATRSRYGNHSFDKTGGLWYFRYHGSPVCVVDPENKTVRYDYCGWEGSLSTKRTVNSYVEMFSSFREIAKQDN